MGSITFHDHQFDAAPRGLLLSRWVAHGQKGHQHRSALLAVLLALSNDAHYTGLMVMNFHEQQIDWVVLHQKPLSILLMGESSCRPS